MSITCKQSNIVGQQAQVAWLCLQRMRSKAAFGEEKWPWLHERTYAICHGGCPEAAPCMSITCKQSNIVGQQAQVAWLCLQRMRSKAAFGEEKWPWLHERTHVICHGGCPEAAPCMTTTSKQSNIVGQQVQVAWLCLQRMRSKAAFGEWRWPWLHERTYAICHGGCPEAALCMSITCQQSNIVGQQAQVAWLCLQRMRSKAAFGEEKWPWLHERTYAICHGGCPEAALCMSITCKQSNIVGQQAQVAWLCLQRMRSKAAFGEWRWPWLHERTYAICHGGCPEAAPCMSITCKQSNIVGQQAQVAWLCLQRMRSKAAFGEEKWPWLHERTHVICHGGCPEAAVCMSITCKQSNNVGQQAQVAWLCLQRMRSKAAFGEWRWPWLHERTHVICHGGCPEAAVCMSITCQQSNIVGQQAQVAWLCLQRMRSKAAFGE